MAEETNWRALYPFESREIILDGRRYHYLDEGDGPALLMVHGNPTWSFYWRDLVRALRGQFRCIVPDHIGCGLSDKPAAKDYSFRLAQRIDDLERLIEHLDLENLTLIAHDWGGAIGMGAAEAMPERFARFVLMNTAAFRSKRCPLRIRLCRIPLLGQVAVQGLNLFVRGAMHTAVAKPERITAEVRAGLSAPYDKWKHRTAVLQFIQDIPLSPRHPSYQTLSNIESNLKQFRDRPVCLIWGMRDWCFSGEFLDRFVKFFPQAEVHRLADAAHYVVEDAHENIVPLLEEFLRRNSLPSTP